MSANRCFIKLKSNLLVWWSTRRKFTGELIEIVCHPLVALLETFVNYLQTCSLFRENHSRTNSLCFNVKMTKPAFIHVFAVKQNNVYFSILQKCIKNHFENKKCNLFYQLNLFHSVKKFRKEKKKCTKN